MAFDLDALEQNYQPMSFGQPQVQKPQPKKQGLGGFLMSLLPGGSLVDKKIRGEHIDRGDVAEEVALSAVPFGLGKVFRGASTASKIVRGAEKVAEKPKEIKGFARGALRQSTIAPTSTLKKASEQDELIGLSRSLPGMRGSAAKKFRNVEPEIGKMTSRVDELLKGVDTKLPFNKLDQRAKDIHDLIPDTIEQKRFANEYRTLVNNAFGDTIPKELSASDLNSKMRRAVNGQLSGVFKKIEAGTQLTDKDEALLKLRDVLSSSLEDLAPDLVKGEVKQTNKNISTLLSGIPEFKKASEEGGKLPFVGRVPGISQAFAGATQGGADIAGRTLTNPLARGTLAQAGVRGAADATGMRDVGAEEDTMDNPQDITDAFALKGQGVGVDAPQAAPTSEYSRETMLADIQKDPDNMSDYIKLYETLNPEGGATDDKSTRGLNSLNQLGELYSQAGGGQSRAGGFLQNVLGKAGESSQVNAYNQVRDGLVAGIARALGETGVLSDQDIARYKKMLPNITDNPEEAQIKIETLKSIMQANQSIGGGTSDAQSALSTAGL